MDTMQPKAKLSLPANTFMDVFSHDLLMRILAPLPRSSWCQLRRVCKAWKDAIEDPYLHQIRVDLGRTEEWCYTEVWNPATKISSWRAFDYAEKKWYALPPIPRKRYCGKNIYGRASTSWRGELYVAGGKAGESGITLRDVYIYSPARNRWRKCHRSMITTRHSPFMYSFGGKIYVIGGFDCQDNLIKTAECYHVETQSWTSMESVNCPEVACPPQYRVGWQVQWTTLPSSKGELYVSYKSPEDKLVLRMYSPEAEEWFPTKFKDKSKALLGYSLAAMVGKKSVMLDWPRGQLRLRSNRAPKVVYWRKVQGMKGLNWVSILKNNPKVSSCRGSKFVIVNRGMTVYMIETHEDRLQTKGGKHVQEFTFSHDGPKLEPLKCVVVDA